MKENLRILYLSGLVDATNVYDCWANNQEDETYFGTSYVREFYQACHEINATTYVVSLLEGTKVQRNDHTIDYRPVPFSKSSGLLYHFGQIWYMISILFLIQKFKPDVFLVVQGRPYWFIFSVLPLLGIKIIPSIHCVLWPKFLPRKLSHKILYGLTRYFFSKSCSIILAASDDIVDQIKELTNNQHKPVLFFLPWYKRQHFVDIPQPEEIRTPFRVLFAGRIEINKGVYDLLEVAKHFTVQNKTNILFELCGKGSQLELLKQSVEAANLSDKFIVHGYCDKPTLKQMYGKSHVVIVPTTTEFIEGFNMVVAEGILAGRPVITSAVCPALSTVREAVIEVQPDDIQGYADAILKLYEDCELYESKRAACLQLQEQFFDYSNSWGSRFKKALFMAYSD